MGSAGSTHRLMYYPETPGLTETATGAGRALMESSSARLPLGWLFLFGSRNVWEPGESVDERGGAAGKRDPAVASVEVARVRLEEATKTLVHDKEIGAFMFPMQNFTSLMALLGNKGQFRLLSPPGSMGKSKDVQEQRKYFLETVALSENLVFHLASSGRNAASSRSLRLLLDRCDFTPQGDLARDLRDLKKFHARLPGAATLEEALARALVGWPLDRSLQEDFSALIQKSGAAFRKTISQPAAVARPWWKFWG